MKFHRKLFLMIAFATLVATAGAQTYTPVYSYGTHTGDPKNPQPGGLMAQGRDGNFYSSAVGGGGMNAGGAFEITPGGTLTKLFDFKSNEGGLSGLTLGLDGNLYGTTSGGGTSNAGTVYKTTPTGTRTTLWNFTSF